VRGLEGERAGGEREREGRGPRERGSDGGSKASSTSVSLMHAPLPSSPALLLFTSTTIIYPFSDNCARQRGARASASERERIVSEGGLLGGERGAVTPLFSAERHEQGLKGKTARQDDRDRGGGGWMGGRICMHAHEGLFTGQSENEAEGLDEAEGVWASGCLGHLARSLPSK
jgi:hypothetical protein